MKVIKINNPKKNKSIINICKEINSNTITIENLEYFKNVICELIPSSISGYTTINFLNDQKDESIDISNSYKNLQSKTTGIKKDVIKNVNTSNHSKIKEQKLLKLLLKIKNGLPLQRKNALKQISIKAIEFGPSIIFHHILPLMMLPNLDDHERHLLVKVVDRILIRLKSLIRPYVSKILLVIEPMLLEEDYFTRVEAREIIASLSKSAGLATMINALRPDIDNTDEFVRSTCARSFAIVSLALGINKIIPFLKAVTHSRRSWYSRHTGIKIIQQIAILMKQGIMPYLKTFINLIKHGIIDDSPRVRIITALTISTMADNIQPYGIEYFTFLLDYILKGIRILKGKLLIAYLKAMSSLLNLMDDQSVHFYANEIIITLKKEYSSSDNEIKKVILKIISQLSKLKSVNASKFKEHIFNTFFSTYWIKKNLQNNVIFNLLKYTTSNFYLKIDQNLVNKEILKYLKSDSFIFKIAAIDTLNLSYENKIINNIQSLLIEEILEYAINLFKSNFIDEKSHFIILITNILSRNTNLVLKYFDNIVAIIPQKLKSINIQLKTQTSFLVSKIIVYFCKNLSLDKINNLLLVLSEALSNEPNEITSNVLSSIKTVYEYCDIFMLTPAPRDLLPRLLPYLKISNDEILFNSINILGIIGLKAGAFIYPKEWMRISFELLELFKYNRKKVRRSATKVFGIIATLIGPHDLTVALLNNLKVQDRHIRICTTIAIAVIAESCGLYTVFPFLSKEYENTDKNIQNGILKSFSFLFEFIGELSGNYLYSLISLLEKALIHSDLIHRQLCCNIIQHLSCALVCQNYQNEILHLFNYVWPNIFENTPQMKKSFTWMIDSVRLIISAPLVMYYVIGGLFHASKKVRDIYWFIYNLLYLGSQYSIVITNPIINLSTVKLLLMNI